jgi:hypothetical protein
MPRNDHPPIGNDHRWIVCPQCEKAVKVSLKAMRKTKYCSTLCRVRAYRRRKAMA